MIVNAVTGLFFAVYGALFSVVPEVTLPYVDKLEEFATLIGSQVGGLNSFLPISEMLPVLFFALVVYLPFVLVFYAVRWVYAMIPVFGRAA